MSGKIEQISGFIKSEANSLGFSACGIAKADFLEEDAPRLEKWLNNNYQGEMGYMVQHFDKRLDPRKLLHGTKSVVTVVLNYYQENVQVEGQPKISRYAYGKDYHKVIKKKLKQLLEKLQTFGNIQGRAFVDSAPVLERSWAQKSGLGWIGKNGMLINNKLGSYYFIGTLLLDIELIADNAFPKDYCGTCTKCIDACPTDAILPNKTIKGNQCISYYTIELKDKSKVQSKQWDDWVFGCDICQEVCPWNRFSIFTEEESFSPKMDILNNSAQDWEQMTGDVFDEISQSSPIRRAKLEGLKKNLQFIKKAK